MKRHFTGDHGYNQYRHAAKRMFERYGLAICRGDYDHLVKLCATGKAVEIGKGRGGGVIYRIAYRSRDIYAVFSTDTQCIATFLPAGKLQELRAVQA